MFHSTDMFVGAVDLSVHPIKKATKRTRGRYYIALSYIVAQVFQKWRIDNPVEKGNEFQSIIDQKVIVSRLELYAQNFSINLNRSSEKKETISDCIFYFKEKKHRTWLLCDIAMIFLNHDMLCNAVQIMKGYLSKKVGESLEELVDVFLDETKDISKYKKAEVLIEKCRKNFSFLQLPEKRVIVTANMSAGKSTLINAIVGKPIVRTSQEVCTANLCCIYNKAFEDGNVHLASNDFTLCAGHEVLDGCQKDEESICASYFSATVPYKQRVCIIDTPGVNASLYRHHSDITYKALEKQAYDKIIYVLSPTNLGTDAEIKYLQWIASHVPKDKILFVLNKLDAYHAKNDNIQNSIDGLRIDLKKLGFSNPIICPISAYFAFLLKLKLTNQSLSEDEQDELEVLSRKFNRDAYDLSVYYDSVKYDPTDTEMIRLSKRCGLFGFEKLLYGGIV